MKRTIIRYSVKINQEKWQEIRKIAALFRDEKNTHLRYYHQDEKYSSCRSDREWRDQLVNIHYKSATGLQARQWKISLKEAYETTHKNWCALAESLKLLVAKHKDTWSENEMHYAYWILCSGKLLSGLVSAGKSPVPEHFSVSYTEKKRVRNYLLRVVRRKRGERPVAKLSRSFPLDADMYSVFEKETLSVENGKGSKKPAQFIKIMGMTPRKMVVVPLTGCSPFDGSIRVILDFHKRRIELHTVSDLVEPEQLKGTALALDAGISEVFTDNDGAAYEPTFGATLQRASDQLNRTGKARNKAHALEKVSSKHKARRIRKFNLGKNKMRDRKRKGKIRVRQLVSQSIHKIVETKNPNTVITENLNIRGKAKSKKMSRLVSYWMRSALIERLNFLALAEGFRHKQVNPAYTSQMCPTCLFVHKNNRRGDIFKCLNCGHTDHADRVAAINLFARANDPDITIYTPKSVVWSILQKRFAASLERRGESSIVAPTTVSGRTEAQSRVRQSETPSPNFNNGYGTEMSAVFF